MNVCSVHLSVVQMPTAQMKREVTIAHVWMDSQQQTQVSPSASITHVEVHFIFTFMFTITFNSCDLLCENPTKTYFCYLLFSTKNNPSYGKEHSVKI